MQRVSIAKVLIRKTDNTYLILRGSVWPERPDRSQKPDLPGGLVEPNESHVEGALREVAEETGIILSKDDLEAVYADSGIFNEKAVTRIIYTANVENAEVALSWEHESYEWMSAGQVRQLEIRDPYKAVFGYLTQIGVLR